MKSPGLSTNFSPSVINRHEEIITHIYHYLNQGNLYRIYQLLEDMRSVDEKRKLEELFVQRFGFNYRTFI